MLDKAIKEFDKYTSNFDLSIPEIDMKYRHTFRVVDYAKKILEEETNDEKTIRLGLIGALLHDIARFKQWTEYETYHDKLSFDHGNMAYEILKENDYINNYVQDEYEKEIILNAVKQHNKKDLVLTNDNLTDTIAKVTRDADKIDIMMTQSNRVENSDYQLNDNLVNDVLNERSCDYNYMNSKDDHILGILGFVFDINYKKSFEIIKKSKIINTKIEALKKCNNVFNIQKIENKINEFIDKKLGDDIYVR